MNGHISNIEEQTLANNNFRQVLYTSKNLQLVIMSLNVGEEIGSEVHPENDQFFRVEAGEGEIVIAGESTNLKDGDVAVVPAGVEHNVKNKSAEAKLKLYTIYTPPHHPDGTIHATKAEAMASESEIAEH